MTKKEIDAEGGKWLTNKAVLVIVVFVASLTFGAGQLIPNSKASDFTKLEERIDKIEVTIAKQSVMLLAVSSNMKELKETIRDGFREVKDDIRQQRNTNFRYNRK